MAIEYNGDVLVRCDKCKDIKETVELNAYVNSGTFLIGFDYDLMEDFGWTVDFSRGPQYYRQPDFICPQCSKGE